MTGFEFNPHPEASSDAREYVRDRLAKVLPPRTLAEAQLLTTEVVTNAVLHAGLNADDVIRLTIDVQLETVCFSVVDPGEGFDIASVLPKTPTDEGGWGLFLVDKLSSRWGNGTSHPHRFWFEIYR